MWRFGVLALVACWSGKSAETTIDNHVSERDFSGSYFCSIEEAGFRYPGYPCAIRKIDGRWMLAKLAGSQRFRGEVKARGEGFSFDGEFYCPWGDCTQPLHGVFKPIGEANQAAGGGALRGTFRDAQLSVMLVPAPDSAFGGASYGGDGYGGFGNGGGYGGNRRR